jgi:D-beta-D-heptose 7-phosphate kinase / D-beta-D-heptose 1-phosphate adenosyltransferase
MLVFTNGCFDILHVGHIQYLEQSKNLGDRLVVGLNSDASVRRLKGHDRPVNSQEDRKRLLMALRCVDEVVIFDEDTPYNLIASLEPDIITKGGDYRPEDVVGYDLAKVVVLPYVDGKSTTRILNHANRREGLGS